MTRRRVRIDIGIGRLAAFERRSPFDSTIVKVVATPARALVI